jgi:hypothetical protein
MSDAIPTTPFQRVIDRLLAKMPGVIHEWIGKDKAVISVYNNFILPKGNSDLYAKVMCEFGWDLYGPGVKFNEPTEFYGRNDIHINLALASALLKELTTIVFCQRLPYLNLLEGHTFDRSNHIHIYLFDVMVSREICSYLPENDDKRAGGVWTVGPWLYELPSSVCRGVLPEY